MSFPPQLLTSTQHYACFLNFSLFRVNYMKKHFDRSLLYEDPPHAVTTAKIELGLQKELQWLTPLKFICNMVTGWHGCITSF